MYVHTYSYIVLYSTYSYILYCTFTLCTVQYSILEFHLPPIRCTYHGTISCDVLIDLKQKQVRARHLYKTSTRTYSFIHTHTKLVRLSHLIILEYCSIDREIETKLNLQYTRLECLRAGAFEWRLLCGSASVEST